MTRRGVTLATAGALLVAGSVAGCNGESKGSKPAAPPGAEVTGDRTVTTGTAPPTMRYSLAATRRCLEQAGLPVGPVGKANSRLQALGDLAQRTSIAVRSSGEIIGIAFGDAELLADLLAVPNDPYTMEKRGNALLLYRHAATRAASAVRRCLRP